MTDPKTRRTDSDEIDLRQLFAIFGAFFAKIGKSIVNTIIRIKRRSSDYKVLVLVVVLTGMGLGTLYHVKSKPIYTSSLLLRSEYFNRRIIDNAMEKLNQLCEEENKELLARTLNIDKSIAANIVEFKAEPFVAEQEIIEVELLKERLSKLKLEEEEVSRITSRIEIENKETYKIIVSTTKSTVINELENAMVNYFRNNNYISNRIKVNKKNLIARKQKLLKEEAKIDTLKNAMIKAFESMSSKSRQGSENLYIGEQYSANPIQVFQEDLRLNEEILNIDRRLFLQADFELIDGMTEFNKPTNKGLFKILIIALLISLGIAYIIIILLEINKYLNRIEQKRFVNHS